MGGGCTKKYDSKARVVEEGFKNLEIFVTNFPAVNLVEKLKEHEHIVNLSKMLSLALSIGKVRILLVL